MLVEYYYSLFCCIIYSSELDRANNSVKKTNGNLYTLFIDESGISSLNNLGEYFVLSCVLIRNDDIPIIQGYFKLLKREFFKDECKNIHCTDLFERPYQCYRKLKVPNDRRNAFLARVEETLKIIPFYSALYFINKNKLRNNVGYKPYTAKKSSKINFDLPYELVARQAIIDFACFLEKKNAFGEIVIESRQFSDQLFVSYFDDARKSKLKGNTTNPYASSVKFRINSLSIANKNYVHTGLELADVGAYTAYRRKTRDPLNKMKLRIAVSDTLHNIYKSKTYVRDASGSTRRFLEINDSDPNDVKPSKLI